jgi:hypothetical protein
MPVSPLVEAGSKYILLISLSFISIALLFGIGLIALSLKLIVFQEVLIYSLLGLFYSLFYGFIIIPASYKYGSSNSKYFFMLFVFVPTFLPLILNKLNIQIDPTKVLNMNAVLLSVIIISIFLVSGMISIYLSIRVLSYKE